MEEIEEIVPFELPKGKFLSLKNRTTRFKNKSKRIGGVNEDLLGPYQPERSKREDHESGCGALNTGESQ